MEDTMNRFELSGSSNSFHHLILWSREQNGTDNPETIVGNWNFAPTNFISEADFGLLIHARGGGDAVYAGYGNDTVWGEGGGDVLHGQNGNDTLFGGHGLIGVVDQSRDFLFGGAGNDRLFGEEGDDVLVGGTGIDQLFGGAGGDIFMWQHTNESGISFPAYLDRIEDFNPFEGDRINLAGLVDDAGWMGLAYIGPWTQQAYNAHYVNTFSAGAIGAVGWTQLGQDEYRISVDFGNGFQYPTMSFIVHTAGPFVPLANWFDLT
jgi:Ca2+-binding RTX toxin-like protein